MVLKASLLGHDFWTIGFTDLIKFVFTPINHDVGEYIQLIDNGKFYASKTFYDPINNQQVVMGWSAEDDDQGAQRGWQGLLTLPRAIFLSDNDLELRTRPIEAVKTLRDPNTHQQYQDIIFTAENPFALLPYINGSQIEILINWQFPMNQVPLTSIFSTETFSIFIFHRI
jgi:beta-fructofuranosidase